MTGKTPGLTRILEVAMHREPDIPIEPDQGPPHPHRGTSPDPVEHEPDRDPSDPTG